MVYSQEIVVRLELQEKLIQDSMVMGSLQIMNEHNKATQLVTPYYHTASNLMVFEFQRSLVSYHI